MKKVGEPEVHVGGPLAAYGTVLDFALRFGLADGIQTQLRDVAQDDIAAAAAQAMSLVHLPPGMRLSVRTISVDSSGITFQPALGAFGTVLSTYQPDPSLLVPV